MKLKSKNDVGLQKRFAVRRSSFFRISSLFTVFFTILVHCAFYHLQISACLNSFFSYLIPTVIHTTTNSTTSDQSCSNLILSPLFVALLDSQYNLTTRLLKSTHWLRFFKPVKDFRISRAINYRLFRLECFVLYYYY